MQNNIFYTYAELSLGVKARSFVHRYGRKPTTGEIKFGHGAWHYKDFDSTICFKKNGDLKTRLKCPVDGLIYTRSKY